MLPAVTELLMRLLTFTPLEVLLQQPTPISSPAVYPGESHGFAAYVVIGGFIGLGILLLAMALLNRRPKRTRPDIPND
jgi:hypothetical protein